MFVKKSIFFALLLLLTGCATTPDIKQEVDPSHFQIPQQHAYIYLYREKTFSSGLAGIIGTIGHNNIFINESSGITLNNAEYYIAEVLPGTHTIKWSLVLMGYETDYQQTEVSLAAGEWTQLNLSNMDKSSEISLKQLKRTLQPLEFIKKIQLTSE